MHRVYGYRIRAAGRQISGDGGGGGPVYPVFTEPFTELPDGDLSTVGAANGWTLAAGGNGPGSIVSAGALATAGTDSIGRLVLAPDLGNADLAIEVDFKAVGGFAVFSATDINNYIGVRVNTATILQFYTKIGGTLAQLGTDITDTNLYSKRIRVEYWGKTDVAPATTRRLKVYLDGVLKVNTLAPISGVPAATSKTGFVNRFTTANPWAVRFQSEGIAP